MIKLYGSPRSTCTRKVLAALHETNTPFELTVVDLAKREQKEPAHLARQPFGQVPTIDDGGFVLFESRAICRYLSAKAGDKLAPATLQERALMDQWASVDQTNFYPHAMKFIYSEVFKRPQEQAVLDAAAEALEKAFGVLSLPLAKQTFLVGDKFSLADLFYMPYLEYLEQTSMKEKLAAHPHVAAWWGRLRERESWRKATGRA